jgi:hypothetical protein
MKNYIIGLSIGAALGAVLTLSVPVLHSQQSREQWEKVHCWTNTCVADLLNSLPAERAAEAKLTTWRDTTYVWYRK